MKFYIKPQRSLRGVRLQYGCILLKFYIKPQLTIYLYVLFCLLYLIEILHQTTTLHPLLNRGIGLYLIEILHQTTTHNSCVLQFFCCILLKFYIKPQLKDRLLEFCNMLYLIEILHQTTTNFRIMKATDLLYLIEILHQTTTWGLFYRRPARCILLKFYIKPQLAMLYRDSEGVVSYWNSTSNHNHGFPPLIKNKVVSYWNSTSNHNYERIQKQERRLYLIEILHQTTTVAISGDAVRRCILLKFYIKPQRVGNYARGVCVVSYWNSTSNHNAGVAICSISVCYTDLPDRKNKCGNAVEVSLMYFSVFQRTKILFF